jgi:arabinan endo-1,5-alpha-L-arabinosidase
MIIHSIPGRDLWNAIDPNLFRDGNTAWLTFGSWWSGIKLVKLSDDQRSTAQPQEWYSIARRPREFAIKDASAGTAAIEAPFIFKKGNYYYLFVSFDLCCQGPQSTYKIAVGRATNIKGPYLDKEGKEMNSGGGSIILQGDKDWYAAGHNSVYTFDGIDYMVFHGYDAADRGRSKLRIEVLEWKEGWPEVKK